MSFTPDTWNLILKIGALLAVLYPIISVVRAIIRVSDAIRTFCVTMHMTIDSVNVKLDKVIMLHTDFVNRIARLEQIERTTRRGISGERGGAYDA